jgi:hypothetical protein
LIAGAARVPDNECDPGSAVWPNNVYGYGRLNIFQSIIVAQPKMFLPTISNAPQQ